MVCQNLNLCAYHTQTCGVTGCHGVMITISGIDEPQDREGQGSHQMVVGALDCVSETLLDGIRLPQRTWYAYPCIMLHMRI